MRFAIGLAKKTQKEAAKKVAIFRYDNNEMKLHAEISGKNHEIEVQRKGLMVLADIDGRKIEAEVSQLEPGVFLIKREGRIFEVSVSRGGGVTTSVRVDANEFEVKLYDPKRLRGVAGDDGHAAGPAEIKTAMPGKVVRLLVEVGAEVEKGDGIVIVEAMKMQNELKAPKAGMIKEIRVTAGTTVAAGETLATIE